MGTPLALDALDGQSLLQIMLCLDTARDLLAVEQTCSTIRSVSAAGVLWRRRLARDHDIVVVRLRH